MEQEHFGTLLREARERRQVSLIEVAHKTKLSRSALEHIEAGNLDNLPPEVFVRGFIRSYAKAVGVPDAEPLSLFDKAVEERRRAEEAKYTVPVKPAALDGAVGDEDTLHPRRGIGLAVFVIIVLVIATITWSLFLRQPPQSGEGLSRLDGRTLLWGPTLVWGSTLGWGPSQGPHAPRGPHAPQGPHGPQGPHTAQGPHTPPSQV